MAEPAITHRARIVPRGEQALAAVTVLAIVGLVVVPLTRLTWVAVGGGGSSIMRVLRAPGFGTAAAHSLELAVLVPLLAVPLGTGIALLLRRPDVPGRGGLRVLVVLPLLIPQFVLGYSWTQAYGRAGFTDDLVGVRWTGLNGPAGIVVVLVVDAAPICYLLNTVGLATRAQPQLELAARASGATGWTALRTVTLPLLRPVLAAEFVLTFVATLESFAAPQVLGTPVGYSTVTTRLYTDLAFGSDPNSFRDAVTLALGLVLVAAVILVPADLVLAPRLGSRRTRQSPGGTALRRRSAGTAIMAGLVGAYAAFAVLLPTIALVAAALTRAIGLAPTPSNWTFDNFRAALDAPTRSAFAHSLQLAVLAAFALTLLGAVLAALERHRPGRLLGTVAMLSFAVPGSALAVGLLIAYDRRLGGTLTLILLAYLAKFWALAHRTVSGAVDRLPAGEWQAARTSGAGPIAAVRTVWLPALAPALIGAWLLVFVSALHEVTMSSLLYSTGSETIAVAVLNSQELGSIGTTAALSVTLTAVLLAVVAPAWLLLRLTARRRDIPAARRRELAHAY
ncbi:MAG: transrane component of transporter [Pseudonocardiales bacterium]|nr:transrane component of transporter [Pseudonocardiales bacterium]